MFSVWCITGSVRVTLAWLTYLKIFINSTGSTIFKESNKVHTTNVIGTTFLKVCFLLHLGAVYFIWHYQHRGTDSSSKHATERFESPGLAFSMGTAKFFRKIGSTESTGRWRSFNNCSQSHGYQDIQDRNMLQGITSRIITLITSETHMCQQI